MVTNASQGRFLPLNPFPSCSHRANKAHSLVSVKQSMRRLKLSGHHLTLVALGMHPTADGKLVLSC
jgi:hypothetical protein